MLGIQQVISGMIAVVWVTTAVGPMLAEDAELKDEDYSRERLAVHARNLNDVGPALRIKGINALWAIGPESRTFVPRLIELLADEEDYSPFVGVSYRVGREAAKCLSSIGSETVIPLSKKFEGQTLDVQNQIVFIARRMGPDARGLLPQILKKYETVKADDRPGFISAIAVIDPTGQSTLPLLLNALRDDADEWIRTSAAEALIRSEFNRQVYWKAPASGPGWYQQSSRDSKVAVDALITALKDPSPNVRASAIQSLATYPEAAERSAPALIRLLGDTEYYYMAVSNHVVDSVPVADAAVEALASLTSQADVILPSLSQGVSDDRGARARHIAQLALQSKQPLDHLTKLLEGKQPELAMVGLARLGAAARPAIVKLKSIKTGGEFFIIDKVKMTLACIDPQGQTEAVRAAKHLMAVDQHRACYFLRQVGPNSSFAVPFLLEQMFDKKNEKELNWDVVRLLAAIGPAAVSAAPTVINCLDQGYSFYGDDKEEALVNFGPAVVPLLKAALETPAKSATHRIHCLNVLARLGSKSADAVSAVVGQLDSKHPRVRKAAAQTLGKIASHPTESLPVLERVLSDPRPFVRAAAAESCGAFGAAAKSSVAVLIKRLSDDYLDVRVAAASALGRLGPIAKDAIPELNKLTNNEDVLLRDSAREALAAINGK